MTLDLKFYWGLLLRRLPVMLALFLMCFISVGVSAIKLKPTYSTSALLLVEEPQIPQSMLGRAAGGSASRQLQIIQEKLLTRANLLDIARKFDVFENIRLMTPDAIVESMRDNTQIRRSGGRDEATLMNVSFNARSGQIAANVVNEYTTLILQESTDFRMRRAEGTLEFFEQEVERLGDDLGLQSGRIVEFKNENSNALPGDLIYRQNRQTQLQERQSRLQRDIAALDKQQQDMSRVFENTGRLDGPAPAPRTPEEAQLRKLESDLQQALAIYSETNPRVTILRNRIEQLRKTVQATVQPDDETAISQPQSVFELTLAEMGQRLVGMREELSVVTEELDGLSLSIQATAGNAIILSALQRDFENIQARYNEAVRNLNLARVNERVEVSAQGERITVLESANVPETPSGPNRFKMIFMGAVAGGGLAVGFFVFLEILNRTIRRPAELQSKFGIIPLAIIPQMETRRDKMVRRGALIAMLLAVLIGVPAALWYIDTSYMPLDVLASKVMNRLGFG